MTRTDQVAELVQGYGPTGTTTNEALATLGDDWTYPVVSSTLSRLHRQGRIAGLLENREGQRVYVAPEHVDGRATATAGRARHSTAMTTTAPAPDADVLAGLVGAITQAINTAVHHAVQGRPAEEAVLEVDEGEFGRLRDAHMRLQADYEAAQERIEELEAAPPQIAGEAVAAAIQAAADKAWNPQAKVALLDVAEAFRAGGQ